MAEVNLRRWLRRNPQPVSVRCDDDGPVITVVRESRSCWGDVEDAITTAGARAVHALDKQGRVLRSLQIPMDEDQVRAEHAELVAQTGRERELVMLAELLERAGDRGALRATEGLQAAVQALVQVVQICVDRTAAVEAQLAAESPRAEGGDLLLTAALQGMQRREAPPPSPPNGATHGR